MDAIILGFLILSLVLGLLFGGEAATAPLMYLMFFGAGTFLLWAALAH